MPRESSKRRQLKVPAAWQPSSQNVVRISVLICWRWLTVRMARRRTQEDPALLVDLSDSRRGAASPSARWRSRDCSGASRRMSAGRQYSAPMMVWRRTLFLSPVFHRAAVAIESPDCQRITDSVLVPSDLTRGLMSRASLVSRRHVFHGLAGIAGRG